MQRRNQFSMFKSITLLCLLTFVVSFSFAQDAERYRSIYLGVGPRVLDTDGGIINTSLFDNSPSMDFFEGSFDVADRYLRLGLQIGYKWGRYNGLSQSVALDVAFGQHSGMGVGYSIGWSKTFDLADGWLTLRPAFFGGFANYGFGIGRIENNASYIQIGSKQYYEPYLDLELRSQVGLYGPELDVVYGITDIFEVWVIANYDLGSPNGKARLDLISPNEEEGMSTIKDLSGDNPLITYNDNKITSLPYKVDGLRLTVGISYVWQRD